MATHPDFELEFTSTGDIGTIRVADIDIGDRLRPIDEAWADALGSIMAREGQRTPIVVCRLPGTKRWTLVAGGHRVAGARLHGIAYLKAEHISADRTERRLTEVSENIWRRGLDPIDRAAFVAELHDLLKVRAGVDPTQSPQQIAANVRWKKELKAEAGDASDKMSEAYGFSDQVADQLGLNRRTIERDLLLYRRLSPSDVERLREARHPVLGNASELRKLAALDDHKRSSVVGLLIHPMGLAKTVSQAVAVLDQRPTKDPEIKRLSAFIGAFQRMGVTERKAALHELVGMMTPVQAITFRDALAEREEAFK